MSGGRGLMSRASDAIGRPVDRTDRRTGSAHDHSRPEPHRRVRRVAAIAESATLAVDAKAKALKAAGEPVIGFGAGEPDFPTPAHIVEAAVAACRDPSNHRYTPAGGLPELKRGHRRQDGARLGLRGRRPARCSSPTAASTPSTTPSPPARPGRRGARCRRRTGRPTPSRSRSPAACRCVLPTDETHRVPGHRRPARGGPHAAHQGRWCSCRRRTRPGAVYPRDEVEAIGRVGRRARRSGSSPTRSTSTSSTATPSSTRCRRSCPSWPTAASSLNGVAKTYAMTGWRVGWMIGPADVIKAATNLQSHATSNVANVSQRAALAAVAGDLDGVADDARAPSTAGARSSTQLLDEHRRRHLPRARGRVLRLPVVQGVLGRDSSRGATASTTVELAESHPRRGQGGHRARRGVRRARLRPAVVRPRRRRPRRGHRRIAAFVAGVPDERSASR